MIWRIALAAFLTLCVATLGQQSRAQFNGCSAGFCGGVAGVVSSVVALDQTASAAVLSASGTNLNFTNQTITGGLSNSALVVVITQTTSTNLTGMTLHWDSAGTNQLMAQVSNDTLANAQTWVFGLLAPTSGNKTLALSWTGTGQVLVSSLSLKGVNQTNNATAFQHATNATGSSITPIVVVTSQVNDLVVSAWASTGIFTGVFSGTAIYSNNGGSAWDGAGSYDVGSASVMATATTTSNTWLGASIDVVHN